MLENLTAQKSHPQYSKLIEAVQPRIDSLKRLCDEILDTAVPDDGEIPDNGEIIDAPESELGKSSLEFTFGICSPVLDMMLKSGELIVKATEDTRSDSSHRRGAYTQLLAGSHVIARLVRFLSDRAEEHRKRVERVKALCESNSTGWTLEEFKRLFEYTDWKALVPNELRSFFCQGQWRLKKEVNDFLRQELGDVAIIAPHHSCSQLDALWVAVHTYLCDKNAENKQKLHAANQACKEEWVNYYKRWHVEIDEDEEKEKDCSASPVKKKLKASQ